MATPTEYKNPFRPGAGHKPPYLAGRQDETAAFQEILAQDTVLKNLVLTGLRGVGKTVLLETFKPIAENEGWIWVGTDMSEQASLTDERMAVRLLTDLAGWTSTLAVTRSESTPVLSQPDRDVSIPLDYRYLWNLYESVPGLPADKLKAVLERVWPSVGASGRRGVVFAYDEAQTMDNGAGGDQFPLSMLLDVFQSVQKKGIRLVLMLAGLPTLFPKLVAARTYAERMFRVVHLGHLTEAEAAEAMTRPVRENPPALQFAPETVARIQAHSGGYPYFIQYICHDLYDNFCRRYRDVLFPSGSAALKLLPVSQLAFAPQTHDAILQKLDLDFFANRWARTTLRQKDLLECIVGIEGCETEFTIGQIAEASLARHEKPFGKSQIGQMLSALAEAGLIYKNARGKYAFALPMLHNFIRRQAAP